MNPNRYLLYLLIIFILIPGCGSEQKKSVVVIGISYEPESLNPLYAFSGYEISITELLYPSLVKLKWDGKKGDVDVTPMLAESILWEDSVTAVVTIKGGISWSDSVEFTSRDVVFSFDLFSDPVVQSRLYGSFINFNTDDDLRIRSSGFEIIDSHNLRIKFREGSFPSEIDFDLPLLPEHVYKDLQRDNIIFSGKEMDPVTCGPFKLKSWRRNQSVILEKNKDYFLLRENAPDEIYFKIIPDYTSRITQLKNGEIDFADDIKIEDVKELAKNDNLSVGFVKGREYDYIGWNNFVSSGNSTRTNPFFGDKNVRKALTLAVNRYEIMNDYLLNYGEVASSSISPIFKEAIDSSIQPYPYNPSAARELLNEAGWSDIDNDGILEKGKHEFSFTLNIPSGNPRRDFAAVVIKNNLKILGVDVNIEVMEPSVFFEKMFNRELKAWIAGWSIPIPQEVKVYWYSDFSQAPFNVAGFRSSEADLVIEKIVKENDPGRKNKLYREMHKILHEENPVTFLYWIDNLVVYNNKRIKNISITPLGAVHHIWEWETDE
jgi:peptide/nickel transport system substrate-binding protein